MERNLLLKDKKGVDLMIGYVLLIVIALALAAAVFFYLKLYLPSEKPRCPGDVDVSIDEVVCDLANNQIYINVTNRGLFSIDSAFIKIGDPSRVFKNTLKDPSVQTGWVETDAAHCPITDKLKPSDKFCGQYPYTSAAGDYEISVEPFIYIDNKPVICTEAVAKKIVVCTSAIGATPTA